MVKKTIAIGGDSQTDMFAGWGVDGWNVWGAQLKYWLNNAGYSYRTRIFGIGGETSTNLLGRIAQLQKYDIPEFAIIYIGVNDPGNSISQATTQLNIQAMCLSLKHGALGDQTAYSAVASAAPASVATQASLPAFGVAKQRYVVLSDTSTTGGVAASESYQAATITGTVANSGPAVWEFRNPLGGELGWGRVATSATPPTVVKKIIVLSTNYLNWTTGGDTLTTPYATYVPVRAAQQAAVTAENVVVNGIPSVVYADLYNFQRSRIVAGTDPNFSTTTYDATKSWHTVQNNQHHNAYGQFLVRQAVTTKIASTTGWSY